jgi:hypothetical protein
MANPANALLGTSAPIITVGGKALTAKTAVKLARLLEKEEAAERAAAAKSAIRARVMDRAIALLQEKRLVIAGQEMDGILAIQYHLAFSGLVGSKDNYKVPTKFGQDVLDITWPFLYAFQQEMGGVDHFLINYAGLSALLLEGAERIEGALTYKEKQENILGFEPGV